MGGSFFYQPPPSAGGEGDGVKSFFKFLLFVLIVVMILGAVGHAKKNNLGPFAPARNLKKSDGALGGSWETDSAFGDDGGGMSSLYDGGGGGMGGGGYMAQPTHMAWSNPAPAVGLGGGPGLAPPSAAEARAALSRRR